MAVPQRGGSPPGGGGGGGGLKPVLTRPVKMHEGADPVFDEEGEVELPVHGVRGPTDCELHVSVLSDASTGGFGFGLGSPRREELGSAAISLCAEFGERWTTAELSSEWPLLEPAKTLTDTAAKRELAEREGALRRGWRAEEGSLCRYRRLTEMIAAGGVTD